MKQVYKCDHCSKTDLKPEPIIEHELICSFNPKKRYCFTCKHSWDSGYDYSIPECKLNIPTLEGIGKGGCSSWCDEDFTNVGLDENNNLIGNCTDCGCNGVLIKTHKC